MLIFHEVAEITESTNAKRHFQRVLGSELQHKRAEKMSMRHKFPTAEAVQLLLATQRQKERKDLMSGGRSSGPLLKTSLETV
jgi:hypothetical protein